MSSGQYPPFGTYQSAVVVGTDPLKSQFGPWTAGTTTSGIQEAIDAGNALYPNGFKVVIGPGTFDVSSTITVDEANASIEGVNYQATILSSSINTSGTPLFKCAGTSGTHINGPYLSDLLLQGNSKAAHALYVQYCNNPVLRNVNIENFVGYGLYLDAVNNGYFADIQLYGCGDATNLYEQFLVDSGGFSDASFYYVTSSNPAYTNVHLKSAADINFYGVALSQPTTTNETQVLLDSGPTRILFDGLGIYGGGSTTNCIEDNADLIQYANLRVNNCSGVGYYKDAGGGSAVITNYQAEGQSSTAELQYAIQLTSTTTGNVTVNGLYLTNVTTDATYNAPGSFVEIRGRIPQAGWLTAPAVPAGTGSTYAVQNTFPYRVWVEATSSVSGTNIIDANGTDKACADSSVQVLMPKEKIYYTTTVPTGWVSRAMA